MQQSIASNWKSRASIEAYRVGEAARFTGLNPQTVSRWYREYSQIGLVAQRQSRGALSFWQLVELNVVGAFRKLKIPIKTIATARRYMCESLDFEFPFASAQLRTAGTDILVQVPGFEDLIDASRGGQVIFTRVLEPVISKFDYSEEIVSAWNIYRSVSINPKYCLGSPHIKGISTGVIYAKHLGGSTVEELSEDYQIIADKILEAIEFEVKFTRISK